MIRSHTFWGKKYRIIESPSQAGGLCDAPWVDTKELTVPVEGSDKYDLELNIHEAMHACFWDLSEDAVTEGAKDVAAFLWRLGWRKSEPTR